MTLPNAHKGVQKLFIAEILNIIGVVLMLFALVAFGAAYGAYKAHEGAAAEGLALGGILPLLAGTLLPIIGVILTLVGLRQASKDEPDRMNKAFWFGIFTLIFAIVAGAFQGFSKPAYITFNTIASILQICMSVFAIMGVSEVTQNISRQDVADMGPKIMVIVIIATVCAIIASIIGNVIGGVAAIIASILMLVAYVVYVVFLARATSALAQG